MKIGLTGAALISLAGLTVAGCALTGPAPGGPLQPGTTTQIGTTWALAYGHATANVGGTRVAGNAQVVNAQPIQGLPFPVRLGLRQSLGGAVEASGDVGWLDSGVELRAGTPGGTGTSPFALAAGFRLGRYPLDFGERTYEGRLRFEVYPDISRAGNGSRRLAFTAGVSAGSFSHFLALPSSYGSSGGDAPDSHLPGVIVVRPEVRLELGIGLHIQGVGGGVTFALAPWILLHGGTPTKEVCSSCTGNPMVTEFSQSWGIGLTVSPAGSRDVIAWAADPT